MYFSPIVTTAVTTILRFVLARTRADTSLELQGTETTVRHQFLKKYKTKSPQVNTNQNNEESLSMEIAMVQIIAAS